MNSDSLNMVSRLGEGHMLGTFFLSEPQLKSTVIYDSESNSAQISANPYGPKIIENVVVAEIYRIPSLGWFYAIELAKTRK